MAASGYQCVLGFLLLLLLACSYSADAALTRTHKQTKKQGKHAVGLRGSSKDVGNQTTDEESDEEDDDYDDDDEEDDDETVRLNAVEKTINPHASEEAKLKKDLQAAKKALLANQQEQLELKASLKEVSDTSKADQEIDASAKKVANETESPAMGKMLGSMWKEMRMFETPFYAEHVQEELEHLKHEERGLSAKVAAAQKKLSDAEKRWKQAEATEKTKAKKQKAEIKTKDKAAKKEETEDEAEDKEEKKQTEEVPVKEVSADGVVPTTDLPASHLNFWAMNSKQKQAALTSSLVYLVLGILVAVIYNHFRSTHPDFFTPERNQSAAKSNKSFSNSLLGCFGEPKICLQGLCCPASRWANTLDNTKPDGRRSLQTYWKAFFSMFILGLLHIYTYGISSLLIVILGVYYRQKLRKAFGLESGTGSTVFQDFLAWCCCLCCAIVQEAREVPPNIS